MALGGGQVDETAFAQQINLAAIFHRIFFDELARGTAGRSHLLQRGDINLHVEVPGVGDHGAVFHHVEMLFVEHVLIAGNGDEDIADLGSFAHGHDAVPIHDGFDGFERIDFGDDDVGAHTLGAEGQAFATPSIAGDNELGARHQHVGAADDAIQSTHTSVVVLNELYICTSDEN